MPDWISLPLGLATLIIGAELLVRGAVWCALALGIGKMIVALTLVAFGTSAPELVVSLVAALQGNPGFATGNVLGSNIANIGLIVGLSAAIKPIRKDGATTRFELAYLELTSILLLVPLIGGMIARWQGIVLFALLLVFTGILLRRARRSRRAARDARRAAGPDTVEPAPAGLATILVHVAFILCGLLGLKFGADWLVQGARGVASDLGLSDMVIGITILAVGTSLPELATSAVAALRGHPEIAIGNVLGSNIFNVCMVLGVTATVRPLPFTWQQEGAAALVGLLLALALSALIRYGGGVGRAAGILLLAAYLGYMAAAVATG